MSEEARKDPGGPSRPPDRPWALFGGSFDPVHRGHLHAARAAREAFGLDEVVFVPAAQPPHKPSRRLAAGRHRLAMIELALGELGFGRASAIELDRGGRSYTIDTARALPAELRRPARSLHLILGADNLAGLAQWREVEELLALVRPIVVARGAELDRGLDELSGRLSERALERLARGRVDAPPVDVSSTGVRRALLAGRDPGAALPDGVLEYARAHGIYGFGAPAPPP